MNAERMGVRRQSPEPEHREIDATEQKLHEVSDMVHRTHEELPDQAIEMLNTATDTIDRITPDIENASPHQKSIHKLRELIDYRKKEVRAVQDIFDSLEKYVAQTRDAIHQYAAETDPERKITLYEQALRELRYLQADLTQIESSSPALLHSKEVKKLQQQLLGWENTLYALHIDGIVPEYSSNPELVPEHEPSIEEAYDGHYIVETEVEEVPADDMPTEQIPRLPVRVSAQEKAKTVDQIIGKAVAKRTEERANKIGVFGRRIRELGLFVAAMFTLSGETNREVENQPPAPEAASLSSEYTESVDDISEETSDDETATTLDTAQETLDTAEAPIEIVPQPTPPTEDEMKRGTIQSGEGLSHALERFTSRADMIQAVNTLELTIDGVPRKLRDVFVKAAGDQIRLSVDQDDSGKITTLHVYDTATGQEITGPDLDRVLSYVPFEKETNADEEPTVLIQSTG